MNYCFDSNIFVSALDPKDAFHSECLPIFHKIIRAEIIVKCPVIILAETCCILSRRINDKELAKNIYKKLSLLQSIIWINISLDSVNKACELGIDTGLKGADSIILQTAYENSIPLVTKDIEIKKKAPKNILILSPLEI